MMRGRGRWSTTPESFIQAGVGRILVCPWTRRRWRDDVQPDRSISRGVERPAAIAASSDAHRAQMGGSAASSRSLRRGSVPEAPATSGSQARRLRIIRRPPWAHRRRACVARRTPPNPGGRPRPADVLRSGCFREVDLAALLCRPRHRRSAAASQDHQGAADRGRRAEPGNRRPKRGREAPQKSVTRRMLCRPAAAKSAWRQSAPAMPPKQQHGRVRRP